MSESFDEQWKETFRKERKLILLWERPFLSQPPVELTEENVLLYLKDINPALKRGRILPLRLVNEFQNPWSSHRMGAGYPTTSP